MCVRLKSDELLAENIPDVDQNEECHQMHCPQAKDPAIYAVFASLCLFRVLSNLQQTLYNAGQPSVQLSRPELNEKTYPPVF